MFIRSTQLYNCLCSYMPQVAQSMCAIRKQMQISICMIECVWAKEGYSESHLFAAVCTEAWGSTTGIQCLCTPVHLDLMDAHT